MNDMTMDAPKRPTMLTVLCIVTFIGIGLMVIGFGLGYVGMKMYANGTMQEMLEQSGDPNAEAQMAKMEAEIEKSGMTADQLATQLVLSIVFALIAFVGVLMMWKLKRMGFFVFDAAVIASMAAPLLMGGKLDTSGGGLVSLAFPLILMALFGTQLKHMR